MPLSAATIQRLRDAYDAVEEWRAQRVAEIDSQVEFLRSVDSSITALSAQPNERATEDAEALVLSIQEG